MIEISLGKLVLLALIALIVLGPEKLPGAARTAGALLRRVRSGWDEVRAEVERELEIEQIRRSARDAAALAEATQNEMKDSLQQVREPLEKVAAEVVAGAGLPSAASGDPAVSGDEAADEVQAELPLNVPSELTRKPPHDHV